jgi:hypothetical protein
MGCSASSACESDEEFVAKPCVPDLPDQERCHEDPVLLKSRTKYGLGPRMCSRDCGRPAFGKFDTCCVRCDGSRRHSEDCDKKGLCGEGCGRRCNVGADGKVFKTCCKSCPHLNGDKGFFGHDVCCDVRDNGGLCPPWYWKSASKWCKEGGEPFHEEVGGDYVRRMGTRLLQKSLPDHVVVKCERIEDAALWARYTAKRAEVRQRAVTIEDIKPETSESLDFSATTTLDEHVNEVWLFHGTEENAARAIAKSNFRMPSSAGNFGKGAYFAEAAKKSHQYSRCAGGSEDDQLTGCRIMLLCRVTLGNMKVVEGTDRQAERLVKDPNIDSVLGKTDFREFLVYDVAQIYPEYIMWYKESTA